MNDNWNRDKEEMELAELRAQLTESEARRERAEMGWKRALDARDIGCEKVAELENENTALRARVAEVEREANQFREVAGLSPLKYPHGRRLPDPELMQDPAYLAHVLGSYENHLKVMDTDNARLRAELAAYERALRVVETHNFLRPAEVALRIRDLVSNHRELAKASGKGEG